jgi:hypothetical protein
VGLEDAQSQSSERSFGNGKKRILISQIRAEEAKLRMFVGAPDKLGAGSSGT